MMDSADDMRGRTRNVVTQIIEVEGIKSERSVHKPVTQEDLMEKHRRPDHWPAGVKPINPTKKLPALRVCDGQWEHADATHAAIKARIVGDHSATGLRVVSDDASAGGVHTTGVSTYYVTADATSN